MRSKMKDLRENMAEIRLRSVSFTPVLLGTFYVPGKPVGKQRPRVTRRGITYTPKKTVLYENAIRTAAQEAFAGKLDKLLDEPVLVRILAANAYPSTMSKKKRESTFFWPTKPDIENIEKAVLDAMEGVVYVNDSRVVQTTVLKYYDEKPGLYVSIYTFK